METLTVETPIPTVSSPVPTAYSTNSQDPSSDARLISKRVANQEETPSLDNILLLTNRFEDILGGTTNSDESNGEEADISNMEIAISASPTPTLRIHKDHPRSQIIGPVDNPIQTRNKFKEISDALQDPSWVEAMQEELFQFKIPNVWTLVDCPKGDPKFPAKVYKVEKAMYGLHQAPRAWYVYVDDIIFGLSNLQLCREFEALMHEKVQMSAMGDILKKFGYTNVRSSNTPMDKENPWGKDRTGKDYKLFPLLGKLSNVSVFLGFGLTFAGTSKFCGVLRILMISLTMIPLGEHNVDFHPMVDFIEASPLKYALTVKPTVYVSHIRQFWSTASNNGRGNQDYRYRRRKGAAATKSRDDAPIKGRSMDEGEAATERVSDDTKEMATVLTSMDAVTVLASRVVNVPTGSGSIPTASTPAKGSVPTGSEEVPTVSLVFATATVVTTVTRRKAKEVMMESKTPKEQKVQEQIDSQSMIDGLDRNNKTVAKYLEEYHQFSLELPMERRIELISDLVKYQDNYTKIYKFQSQQRKPWTKKQKRDYYIAVIKNTLGWKVKDFRGMTFEEAKVKFNSVWKQMEDFIPIGSKEEAERINKKGINLEQESAKKQKTSEEVTKEAKPPEEVTEEKVKEMMQLIPIEEVYVEALQVKHPIID
nr:hypothetical protein [Tanacetum cinerariifolium]